MSNKFAPLSEEQVEKRFENIVNYLKEIIGHDVLDTSECDYWGNLIFGDKYKGTYASDDIFPNRGYSIINVDPSDKPGSHWLAYSPPYVWDSFARHMFEGRIPENSSIIRFPFKNVPLNNVVIKEADTLDANQKKNEVDCGIRCLAWLYIVKSCGIENAKKV